MFNCQVIYYFYKSHNRKIDVKQDIEILSKANTQQVFQYQQLYTAYHA